jgi:YD repeat-containing protein
MQYDSHGRMVVNVEPNTTDNYVTFNTVDLRTTTGTTKPWRYAYNALGELLGTSDARGCGQNFHYDQVGRLLAEEYSPCQEHHTDYTAIGNLSTPDTATGAEVYYLYDQQTASAAMPASCNSSYLKGRTVAVFDKASATKSIYDARGRVTQSCLRVADPAATKPRR